MGSISVQARKRKRYKRHACDCFAVSKHFPHAFPKGHLMLRKGMIDFDELKEQLVDALDRIADFEKQHDAGFTIFGGDCNELGNHGELDYPDTLDLQNIQGESRLLETWYREIGHGDFRRFDHLLL